MTPPGPEPEKVDKRAGGTPAAGRSKILIIAGALVVIAGAGLAGAHFAGMTDPLLAAISGGETPTVDPQPAGGSTPVFYDMPDFVISLNTTDRKARFMKIRVSLEIEDKGTIPELERLMPRIVDNIQVYLRELRTDDVKGSAGTHRLREELLRRINASIAPLRIGDVLFNEILLQ
ncbi:MAG: flagellar basal body-associated FliL family protein [Rhodospirillales bacterium]